VSVDSPSAQARPRSPPTAVLAGLVAVGLVFAVIPARLVLWLPATLFAGLAVAFVPGRVSLAVRLTPADR
jgi:hypothetical protein